MKAIVYRKYGPPNVLELDEVEKPSPKDNEVLIRVHAAEATKSDCEMRSFKFPVQWFWLPLRIALGLRKPKRQILGGYFAGEIEAVGKDVSRLKVGDEVFGSTGLRMGAYGEYMCISENATIVTKPENISFEDAAAVPLGGLNALHFLTEANIQSGEKVLINGAGGSIGTFGVQIAKSMGAQVTAVDSSIKEEMLRQIGADHFIDYTKEDFTKNGQSYDVILNMVAKASYTDCINLLNPKGHYLMANARLSNMFRSVYTSKFTDKKAVVALAKETNEELETLKEMIEAGQINSVVDKVYSMAEAVEAHQRVETEQRLGSIVISIGT